MERVISRVKVKDSLFEVHEKKLCSNISFKD